MISVKINIVYQRSSYVIDCGNIFDESFVPPNSQWIFSGNHTINNENQEASILGSQSMAMVATIDQPCAYTLEY